MTTDEVKMVCDSCGDQLSPTSKYTDKEVLEFIASGEQLIDEQADAVVAYNIRFFKRGFMLGLPFTLPPPVRRIERSLQQPFRLGQPFEEIAPSMTPAQLDIVEGIRTMYACMRLRSPPVNGTVTHVFGKAFVSALYGTEIWRIVCRGMLEM
jgi:hypothetical protein